MSESPAAKILRCLQNEYPRDMSIKEIAQKTGIHRNTVSKYIWGLEREGKVEISRRVGRAKMYTICDTAHAGTGHRKQRDG